MESPEINQVIDPGHYPLDRPWHPAFEDLLRQWRHPHLRGSRARWDLDLPMPAQYLYWPEYRRK